MGYIYAMFLRKRYYYLLFFIAYIGALMIEKPVYEVNTVRGLFFLPVYYTG